MKELGSCDGGISGEHLITKSIMLLLKGDDDFSISGVPWLARGETRIIPPKNLTANCLCRKHNSALSPVDTAALYFFTALKSCLECEAQSARYLVCGHDIERWLLKTAKAMAVSKNLARGGERLSGAFSRDAELLNMLDDPTHWPDDAGLYCVMDTGHVMQNDRRLQVQPYMNEEHEINGVAVNIMGLIFVLMLEAPDLTAMPHLKTAQYRPGQICIDCPTSTNWIAISWDDDLQHRTVSLQYQRTVPSPRHLLRNS